MLNDFKQYGVRLACLFGSQKDKGVVFLKGQSISGAPRLNNDIGFPSSFFDFLKIAKGYRQGLLCVS